MSFPRYPEYKDSEVEWLREVPAHWNVSAVKYLLKPDGYKAGPFGSALITSNLSDTGAVLVMTPEHVARQSFDLDFNQYLPDERIVAMEVFKVQQGDVVLPIVGTLGRAMVIAHPIAAILNQRLARISPDVEKLHPQYLKTLLTDYDIFQQLDLVEGKGAILSHITKESLINRRLAVPPLPEQKLILAFLDRETAKIDALVAEQEKLIALLQEKRQAVISHAVTKGLNPNAPMKDSGVEWLGEVPSHWSVKAIKWLSPVLRGASPRPIDDPKYFDDDGEYAWVRIADSTASTGMLTETTQRLSALGSSLSVKLEIGQLFVSIAGTVGKPCITAIKACIHDGFVYFPRLQINPKFLFRIFEAGVCYGGLGKMGTQLNLNTDTIGSIRIAVPPPEEMTEVLSFIDRETVKLDTLMTEARTAITLLQERRIALISAAVTGQIDVRGWAQAGEASNLIAASVGAESVGG